MGYSLGQIPTHMSREEIPEVNSSQLRHHPLNCPKEIMPALALLKTKQNKTLLLNKKPLVWLTQ